MTRKIFCLLFLALPAFAQQNEAQKPVAVINGETITEEKLNQLYNRLGTQMREQYEKAGGKAAFLDNYIRKRLVVQEAIKSGFDRKPDVKADMDASKESTLFDRYVRDVVAGRIVTDAEVRDYYDKHPDEFVTPEKIHVRHIVVTVSDTGPRARSKQQALEIIERAAVQLRESNNATRSMGDTKAASQLRINQFAQVARQISEDASAPNGGDLGWVSKGQLDPDFEAAAWGLPIGIPSGIVQTKYGYHIIMVDAKKPSAMEAFDDVRSSIREFLTTQKAADVMQSVAQLTNQLMAQSKIAVYPENIK